MSESENRQQRQGKLDDGRLPIWHAWIVDRDANGSLRLLDTMAPYEYKLNGNCWFCVQCEMLDCDFTEVDGVCFYRYPGRNEHRDWRLQA